MAATAALQNGQYGPPRSHRASNQDCFPSSRWGLEIYIDSTFSSRPSNRKLHAHSRNFTVMPLVDIFSSSLPYDM